MADFELGDGDKISKTRPLAPPCLGRHPASLLSRVREAAGSQPAIHCRAQPSPNVRTNPSGRRLSVSQTHDIPVLDSRLVNMGKVNILHPHNPESAACCGGKIRALIITSRNCLCTSIGDGDADESEQWRKPTVSAACSFSCKPAKICRMQRPRSGSVMGGGFGRHSAVAMAPMWRRGGLIKTPPSNG